MATLQLPTTGVAFTSDQIKATLESLVPPLNLLTYESTTLGYNNQVYFLETVCRKKLVLKVGGRYWRRQKTEAEVAALLVIHRLCAEKIRVPRVLGFDSKKGEPSGLPWEWLLLRRIDGVNMATVWDSLVDKQKVQIAEELAAVVIQMQKVVTPQSLRADTTSRVGNLSLTAAEQDPTALGNDHLSFPLDDSLEGRIHISRILNGPPASSSYLEYAKTLLELEVSNLERPEIGSLFANKLQALRVPRLRYLLDKMREHPILLRLDHSNRWKPVFTHGDLQAQNVLILSTNGDDVGLEVAVVDWEWAGFFPPHIEWEAGLNSLAALFGKTQAKSVFMSSLHAAGIVTPESADREEWECALNMTRLTECVVPWWLGGYSPDGGEGETRENVEEKRQEAADELDKLLDFFQA